MARFRPLVALVLVFACSAGGGSEGSQVVAEVGGDAITLADLDDWIKDSLLAEQIEDKSPAAAHEFRSERLERMIDEKLIDAEAATRGVEREALLEQVSTPPVNDADVQRFYEQNQARLGGATLEQIAPRIRQHLAQQSSRDAMSRFVADLRQRAQVEVTFEAPRTEVAAIGPALGPESAPVTIIEFSDFECPFCARVNPTVKQVLARYPEQVRLVYRHFPLDSIHPRARPAAEASACAADQGQFWKFHDLLFENPDALEDADLERYAVEAGLDVAAFRACRAEGRHRATVERDLEDARAAGVTGTPSFFINGRMLGGAQPVEAFVRVIESELSRPAPDAGAASGR